MKNPELYHRTVDILVKAYVDGYLNYMSGCACAVGNIICANLGLSMRIDEWGWFDDNGGFILPWWKNKSHPAYDGQIIASGYNVEQIYKIESVFMFPDTWPISEDDNQYHRLMAVIDVLDQIHEVTDGDVTTQSKSRFVKAV